MQFINFKSNIYKYFIFIYIVVRESRYSLFIMLKIMSLRRFVMEYFLAKKIAIVIGIGAHATILMVRVIVWLVSYMFTLHEWVG